MTILAFGGESATYDLPAGHSYAIDATNGGPYDVKLSRCSMTIAPGSSELILPFAAQTEIYLHFYLDQKDVSLNDYFFIRNSAGTEDQYRIKMNADGKWDIDRWDGAAFVNMLTTTVAMLVNSNAYIDIRLKQDNVNGAIEIYKDTVVVGTFTGNTSTPSTMGQVRFTGLPGGTEQMNVSQVIVATTTLLNYRLGTLFANADGTHTTWTGDYTNIDEIAPNANDFVEINNVGALESFQLSDVHGDFSSYNVKGFAGASRFSIDNGSIVVDNEILMVTNGNDFLSGPVGMVKDGSLQSKQYVWETNPATGQPWTITELNAVQVGAKSI